MPQPAPAAIQECTPVSTPDATQAKRPCSHSRRDRQARRRRGSRERAGDAPRRPHGRRGAPTSGRGRVSSRLAGPRAAAARRRRPRRRRRTPTRAPGRRRAPRPPPACPVRCEALQWSLLLQGSNCASAPSTILRVRSSIAKTGSRARLFPFSLRAGKARLDSLRRVAAGGGPRACTTPCPTFRMCPRRPARRQQRTTASRSTSGGANSSMGSTLPWRDPEQVSPARQVSLAKPFVIL